jgi:hypothetical protein
MHENLPPSFQFCSFALWATSEAKQNVLSSMPRRLLSRHNSCMLWRGGCPRGKSADAAAVRRWTQGQISQSNYLGQTWAVRDKHMDGWMDAPSHCPCWLWHMSPYAQGPAWSCLPAFSNRGSSAYHSMLVTHGCNVQVRVVAVEHTTCRGKTKGKSCYQDQERIPSILARPLALLSPEFVFLPVASVFCLSASLSAEGKRNMCRAEP